MMYKMRPEPILHVKDEDKDQGSSQIIYQYISMGNTCLGQTADEKMKDC